MIKLLALDVDNTIAKTNKPILEETIKLIKEIQNLGTEVMLISGKPTSYLSGLARQAELNDILLSGENGLLINIGHSYPPKTVYKNYISKKQKELLLSIHSYLEETFQDKIWFQPNEVQVAVFYENIPELSRPIIRYLKEIFKEEEYSNELRYYLYDGCIDVLPKHISKGKSLKMYMDKKNIESNEIITIGDSINDISMFEVSDISIGINTTKEIETTLRFEDINDALNYIKDYK